MEDGKSSVITSLERVLMALEHKEADRIPFDSGSSGLTGINIHTYSRLRDHLGLPRIKPVLSR